MRPNEAQRKGILDRDWERRNSSASLEQVSQAQPCAEPAAVSQGWAPVFTRREPKARHKEGEQAGAQGDQRSPRLCFPPVLGLDSKQVCKTGNLTDRGEGEGGRKIPYSHKNSGKTHS